MKARKLTVQEFAVAIRLGHGRAMLHVLEYGDDGLQDEIERALLTNYVWDMQLEGSRSEWLSQLVEITGRASFYVNRIYDKFKEKQKSYQDQIRQIELSRNFFELGHNEFRLLVAEKFKALIAEHGGKGAIYGRTLIDVAGLAGFEFAVQTIGLYLQKSEEYAFGCADLLEYARDALGKDAVGDRVDKLMFRNMSMKAFLDASACHTDSKTPDSSQKKQAPPALDDFLAMLQRREQTISVSYYRKLARNLSAGDIQQVFALLIDTEDSWEQLALLKLFRSRQLPIVNSKILDLLDSADSNIYWAAASALGHSADPQIHEKALALLRSEKNELVPIALELLVLNYNPTDEPLIKTGLSRLSTPELIHAAGIGLINIAAKASGTELAECLLWLYENGPDTWCRRDILERLVVWHKCPEEVLFESQWDAGSEVQSLSRGVQAIKELR